MKRFLAVLFLFLILSASHGFAKSLRIPIGDKITPAQERKMSAFEASLESYGRKCADKFDFGMMNFFMGWTTLFAEPMNSYQNAAQKENKFKAAAAGAGKGLVLFPVDIVGGVLNAATAPVPVQIPLPKNGVDLTRVTGSNYMYPYREQAATTAPVTANTNV